VLEVLVADALEELSSMLHPSFSFVRSSWPSTSSRTMNPDKPFSEDHSGGIPKRGTGPDPGPFNPLIAGLRALEPRPEYLSQPSQNYVPNPAEQIKDRTMSAYVPSLSIPVPFLFGLVLTDVLVK